MSFFGIDLFLNNMDELIYNMFRDIELCEKRAYYAINPDCMLRAKDDIEYYEILKNKKNKIYVDGKWIINTQKILNLPVAKERIATTDLFPRILELSGEYNRTIKIFLLGGRKGTTDKLIENMQDKFKNINFIGHHHGYFEKENCDSIIEYINKCNPDIVFVGFGCPIQEKWVNKNIDKIKTNVIITCGGLFDYYSNNVKRAPEFMQKIGMEWLFRLIQEPRRLYKRYIFGNMRYLINIIYLKAKGERYIRYNKSF